MENSLTIKIPPNGDPKYWFKFINKYIIGSQTEISNLIIDFNTVNFLDTDDIVLLACLLDLYYREDLNIKFINGTAYLNKHLSGIKFKKYWSKDFNRDKFTFTYNENTLCLWHISPGMISDYSQYAKKYYERIPDFKGKDLIPLTSNMSEIFNNIFDHSFSKVNGYIITQYSNGPKKISFSVCDFGIGIAKSLNDYYEKKGENRISDSLAIKNSLITGVSSFTTDRNRGFGLSHVLNFTEHFDGEISIHSNNGYLNKKSKENYFLKETGYNFSGTLIKVEINSAEFEEIDEESNIYDIG